MKHYITDNNRWLSSVNNKPIREDKSVVKEGDEDAIANPNYGVTTVVEHPDGPKTPRVLSKPAFQDYAVSRLGGGVVGMGRFTAIMDAARDSSSGAVRFAYARYQAAMTFEKKNTEDLTTIMAGDSQSGHITADERDAILANWPEG